MSREEIEKLANEFSPMMFADVLRYWGEDAAQALTALLAENERLREALTAMVDDQVEYMTINKLGDPEKQHVIRAARAALNKDPDQ